MIVGDTHGNIGWLRKYIFPIALTVSADAVIVLGDFGAWEHTPDGVAFFDSAAALAMRAQIPLYWLRGNHDKTSHTLATYPVDRRGFVVCRDWLFHIPDGLSFTWGGVSFRVFGGAYSVDKASRVQAEQEKYLKLLRASHERQRTTGVVSVVAPQQGTLWFPEEEMTDSVMTELLAADSGPKDIILSHDKPYSAKPGWNRKDLPDCIPNQLRLERALRAHHPAWWFHGHLHYHYTDVMFTGGYRQATVVGLAPDNNAAEPGWDRKHTWAIVDTGGGEVTVKLGAEQFLDVQELRDHTAFLS